MQLLPLHPYPVEHLPVVPDWDQGVGCYGSRRGNSRHPNARERGVTAHQQPCMSCASIRCALQGASCQSRLPILLQRLVMCRDSLDACQANSACAGDCYTWDGCLWPGKCALACPDGWAVCASVPPQEVPVSERRPHLQHPKLLIASSKTSADQWLGGQVHLFSIHQSDIPCAGNAVQWPLGLHSQPHC